jgi:predicted alpha/beta hydrolase family esterase
MLARFLRLSLALQWLLVAIVAWLLVLARLAWWLAVPLAVLLPYAVTALILGIEFLTGAMLDRRPGRRLGPLAALRLWWRESCTSFLFFSWKQPFAADFAEPPLVTDPRRPALLLVHGYMCNRAVWEPLLASGRLAGCNVATVNLEPVFGPIEKYAEVLDRAIERLRAATGAPRVTLVCHSMGGLAARAYLHAHGDDAVERVVTIATPHDGTLFGAFGSGHNARQMRKGTAYLRGLIGAEPDGRAARFVCIASVDDNLIIPRASPLLAGSRHLTLEGVGHLALLVDPRLWDLLRELLVPPAVQRDMSSAT